MYHCKESAAFRLTVLKLAKDSVYSSPLEGYRKAWWCTEWAYQAQVQRHKTTSEKLPQREVERLHRYIMTRCLTTTERNKMFKRRRKTTAKTCKRAADVLCLNAIRCKITTKRRQITKRHKMMQRDPKWSQRHAKLPQRQQNWQQRGAKLL